MIITETLAAGFDKHASPAPLPNRDRSLAAGSGPASSPRPELPAGRTIAPQLEIPPGESWKKKEKTANLGKKHPNPDLPDALGGGGAAPRPPVPAAARQKGFWMPKS